MIVESPEIISVTVEGSYSEENILQELLSKGYEINHIPKIEKVSENLTCLVFTKQVVVER